MNLDADKCWKEWNKDTKITWTEKEVYKEWQAMVEYQEVNIHWCQLMMAGILGSRAKAVNKYPELFI
ncbi:MAG: hypothetical protein ACYDD5_00570 [Sulfuricurvum sp.]